MHVSNVIVDPSDMPKVWPKTRKAVSILLQSLYVQSIDKMPLITQNPKDRVG